MREISDELYPWVILRKTAYFSNEILKKRNRYFLFSFHGNFFYIYVLEAIFNFELKSWGWGYSGQKIE